MMMKKGVRGFLLATLMVFQLPACNDSTSPQPIPPKPDDPDPIDTTPELIESITEVSLNILESDPPQLSIIAKGNVSSTGWSGPELVAYTYIMPPQDGIYDFSFMAVPPAETNLPAVTPIEAKHVMNPLGADLKGVRIHSSSNNVVAMLENSTLPAAYFEFKGSDPNDRFVIKLISEENIKHARDLLSGATQESKSVMGTIVKEAVPYNPGWSYHLAPESISFFEMAVEVCDANMRYVEEHLEEVGGSFLPKNQWCPWGSELTREIMP